MPFITCHGYVRRNGAVVANAVVGHVCGLDCPSWDANNPAQRATTNASGYYTLQFDAGPEGSRHRLGSTVPNNPAIGLAPDFWVEAKQGVTTLHDFALP